MVDCDDCLGLDDLKKEYGELRKKYNLPDFFELNKLFDIEDVDAETDFLLRKIRRIVSERIAGYLRFVEVVLNPSNGPMFFFKMIKKLEEEDRKNLLEVSDILGKFEVEVLILDIDYSEENEAEFVNNVFEVFEKEIKGKLLNIIKKMNNGNAGVKKNSDEGYVG